MMRRVGCVLVVGCVVAAMLALLPAEVDAMPVAQFATQTSYVAASSANPIGVAVGDLNGDGHVDVVTAISNANAVSVLLGSAGGAFGAASEYATGTNPQSVAVADLNGDGRPDVVTANMGANDVSVLLGNGDGTFRPQIAFATGSEPQSVAVADVNGDGHLDLITANFAGNTVSVLLGNGDGTFAPHADSATGAEPQALAVGDVNGDGHPDVVTADAFFANVGVSVLLGNGDGSFAPHADYAAGNLPRSVSLADLNGDGHLDVITANDNGTSVSVLLGNGDGTLAPHVDYVIANPTGSGTAPQQLAVADLNGDGHPDVATVDTNGSTVSVLMGNGDGTLASHTDFATGGTPQSVAVADVNGDSRPDLVIGTTIFSSYVSVLINTPSAPGPPTIGTAIAGNGSATVSWTAPASDGGSPIVGYVVFGYVGYAPARVRIFNSPLTTQTVTGLTNGTQYRFRVAAYNAIGISGYSKVTNPVTPHT
jgi:hypothetical protein